MRNFPVRTTIAAFLLFAGLCHTATAGSRQASGRIMDENGKPVANADVDFFWRANGPITDDKGRELDPSNPEDNKVYWGRIGQMASNRKARSDAEGHFSLTVPDSFFTLMALDSARTHGGLATIPKRGEDSPVNIVLRPLVRIKGTVENPAGKRPEWFHVYANLTDDPTRPLDAFRLAGCGSLDGTFAMSLPPGRYKLNIYTVRADDTSEGNATLDKTIELLAGSPQVDLGALRLIAVKDQPNINDKIRQSQASGAMRNYKQHYGEKLPEWSIADGGGASKNLQLSDLRGKWVIIDFWALNCAPCLRNDLPRLAKFYEEHQAQRDRFEIVAICIDCNGTLKSIAEVDKKLEPIVKHAWGGKPLPFPVLLDPSMTTLERFGVPGYETILVNPEGRLVEGDETKLAEILQK